MAMKATPKHSSIAIKLGCARCLFRSATPFKLEIVQITSERVSHLGSSAFAPVGRGTADHPDRDRQRDKHTADRRPDRQTRLPRSAAKLYCFNVCWAGSAVFFLNIQLNTYTRRRHHGPDRTQHHLAGNRRIQHVRTRARPVAAPPKKRQERAPAASNVKHAGAGPQ